MAENQVSGVEGLTPAEIARKVEKIGVTKAGLPFYKMAVLGTLAGMFVALGGVFFMSVTTDMKVGYGIGQLIGGLVFNVGLVLVMVAGAELFTGNTMLTIALTSGKIGVKAMLRNWATVWTFNFVGSLLVMGLAFLAEHYTGFGNQVGARILAVGASKASLPFAVIFWRGIICNMLVCLAVWMGYSARSVADKVLVMFLPITAFVAAGMEHSVANMFFIPYAMLMKGNAAVMAVSNVPAEKLEYLTMSGLIGNLIPATLGNIIGGAVLVGLVYWVAYIWDGQSKPWETPAEAEKAKAA